MASKSNLPKWSTSDRQAYLLKLWSIYGNKCLEGHSACPIPSHYIYTTDKASTIGRPVKIKCIDRQGNPIVDSEGNQLFLTLYRPVSVKTKEATTIRLYDLKAEQAIANWKLADMEQRIAEYQAEELALHRLCEPKYPLRGVFSAISRDIWASNQPLFYLDGLGMSGVTLKPFAKVRLSSSYLRLYVDLGNTLRGVSKNKRRKAIRYGKPLPMSIEETIRAKIREAVKHYLDH